MEKSWSPERRQHHWGILGEGEGGTPRFETSKQSEHCIASISTSTATSKVGSENSMRATNVTRRIICYPRKPF
jgi:hypothetical protein